MKTKSFLMLCVALRAFSCKPKSVSECDNALDWAIRMADSELARGVPGANANSPRFKWDYACGVGLKGLLDLYDLTGDTKYYDYVADFSDTVVAEDGSIKTYRL